MGILSDIGDFGQGVIDTVRGKTSIQAAGASEALQREAIEEMKRQFNLNREDLAPFLSGGLEGQNMLLNLFRDPSSFMQGPGADFALNQGIKAQDRSAAARGRFGTGAHSKDLIRFGQGQHAQQFNNRIAQLLNLASGGRQVATSQAGLGQNTANSISNTLSNIGNTRAAGIVGQGNAINNLINQGIGLLTGG